MKISDVIARLEALKKEHGDLPVAISKDHEYWGSVESFASESSFEVKNAQPNGPKKPGQTCLVIGSAY